MFKEIKVEEINEYKDSISLFKDAAVTMVKKDGFINPMTIGWGALGVLWSTPCLSVYIHKTRYSKVLFDDAKTFAVCFFNDQYKDQVRYFGRVSGRDEDKVKNSTLKVNDTEIAPYFEEAELVIICKKMAQSDFDINSLPEGRIENWYKEEGVHTIYYGEIQKILRKI